MARKKRKFYLNTEIKKVLRDLSVRWPSKKEARDLAKVRCRIGTYKNGKPKFKNKYQCAECKGLFDQKETQMDHIEPVVDPIIGFVDWNTFIARLFVAVEMYQCLCKPCHEAKSKQENANRSKKRAKST